MIKYHSTVCKTTLSGALAVCFLLTSFSGTAQSPGGVSSGLVLWVKGNAGISSTVDGSIVSDWFDQSPNASDLIAGNTPLYVKVCSNYNPGVFYDASSYHAYNASIPVSNSSLFVAGIPLAASSSDVFRIPWASDGEMAFPLAIYNGAVGHYTVTGGSPIGQPSSYTWSDDETSFAREHIYSSNDADISKQGGPVSTLTGVFGGSADAYYYLGSDPNVADGPEGFGKITESIIYDNATMDPADIKKIESYLGLKYSVTLDNSSGGTAGDYLLSDGTTVWDADDQPSHHQDIIAIVRDDASGLLQKQSHSQDDKIRVFVGGLATENISNTGTISNDLASLVIGHNGGWLSANPGLTKPAGILYMLGRSWKITNTNFTDDFTLEIKWDSTGPFQLSDLRLLVSETPDLSTATLYDESQVNFSLGSIIVGGINEDIIPAGSTRYISIGSVATTTTLPVNIISFTAAVTSNNLVVLDWQTASEINNAYFTVERSADGIKWEPVVRVNSSGNSNAVKTYSVIDKTPYSGQSYYRLQQTDLNGNYKYSFVRTLKIDKNRAGATVLYPNPVGITLMIKGDAASLAAIHVFAMDGKEVSSMIKIISRTNTLATLDVSKLIAGSYLVKAGNTTSQVVKK